MKAWLFNGVGQPLERVQKDDPVPEANQVVVDVKAAGLCHSDVGFLDGTLTPILSCVPIVLGHEVAGVVSSVGPEVTGFEVGDRVAIAGYQSDAPGIAQDGGFGSKAIGKVEQLVRIPEGVSFQQAAAATDAGQTSYNAVIGNAGVTADSVVGIVGLGGLGLTGARIAVLTGAKVYGATRNHDVWPKAKELGVLDVVSSVSELAQFEPDIIIDFAGAGETTADAMEVVKPHGKVVVVGLDKTEITISTMTLITRSVHLIGSNAGHKSDVEAVMQMMAEGDLEIIASSISWEDIPKGLELLEKGCVQGRLIAEYE